MTGSAADPAPGPVALTPPTAPRGSARFTRRHRLIRPVDFQSVFDAARPLVGRYMVLRVRPNGGDVSRLGVISSRKVGGAVARNRARRLLREAWRLNRGRFCCKVDAVLIARRPIVEASGREVERELVALLERTRFGLASGDAGHEMDND